MTVAVVLGTRPEAIKLAPVVHELRRRGTPTAVVSTGQHREMLIQTCAELDLVTDHELQVMRVRQTLSSLTSLLIHELDAAFSRIEPSLVIVQGDTTTAFSAALAAYYHRLPVAHVEAGLRTGDIYSPFPEEVNRRLISAVASWNFAPTLRAMGQLIGEGIPVERIEVTGNTVIDALLWARERAHPAPPRRRPRRGLVTLHRRESHGAAMAGIAGALRRLAGRGDLEICLPVHKNPAVSEVIHAELDGVDGVSLTEPLGYLDLVGLLDSCDLVLTDSGGLQEEAPALGKPVLVLRDTTERPEAIDAGTALLIGTDPDRIVECASDLLDDDELYRSMATAVNPFGDGQAAQRIVSRLLDAPLSDVLPDVPDPAMAGVPA